MHTEFKHMFIYIYVCASMHVCIVRIYVQMSVSMRKHVYIYLARERLNLLTEVHCVHEIGYPRLLMGSSRWCFRATGVHEVLYV